MRHVWIAVRFHQSDRREHRHRRLTDRDHMRVAAKQVQNGNDVVDVIIEIEAPFGERHHARIDPFRDVDIVIGQESLDRAAQECGVMARHRRDDQQLRLRTARRAHEGPLEVQQPAERTLPNGLDVDRNLLAADGGRIDAPFRPAVAPGRTLEKFHCRRNRLSIGGMRQRIGWIFEEKPRRVGKGSRRIERGVPKLVKPVHWRRQQRPTTAGERRCSAEFTYCH